MKVILFWTLPLIAPELISVIAGREGLTMTGVIAVELLLSAMAISAWFWCGIRIHADYRKTILKAASDDLFASSWPAKMEGETYVMVPANERMREKIRETNRLVMDIGRDKEPAA